MSDPRPTSELAADVRAGLVRAFDPDAKLRIPNPAALAALSALVARVTDLEAQVGTERERFRAAQTDMQERYARKADRCDELANQLRAAEAQVAALTQELDTLNDDAERIIGQVRERAEAAEAAVATQAEALRATRQALAEAADELRKHGSEYRDSHGDYVSERRADEVLGIARRALAATDTNNAS